MQLANVLVALGGDRNNVVPKAGVTVPEIAVLLAIHGDDAVHEIEPLDEDVPVSAREELDRLLRTYPAKNEDREPIVGVVYPGRSPRLHERIEDLGLNPELFRVTERAAPAAAAAKPVKAARKPRAAAPKADADDIDAVFAEDDEGAGEEPAVMG